MGIKDLLKFCRTRGYEQIQYELDFFEGKKIAVDASILVNCYGNISYKRYVDNNTFEIIVNIFNDKEIVPAQTIREYFTRYILSYFKKWIDNDTDLIVVFDGESPEEKQKTKEKRSKSKQNAQRRVKQICTKIKECSTQEEAIKTYAEEARKILANFFFTTDEDYVYLYNILDSMGLHVFKAPGEAERFCCRLYKCGIVQAVNSRDTDCLAYGVETVITNVKSDGIVECHSLMAICECLNFSKRRFLEFCICLGNDYNERKRGYGPMRCFTLLEEVGRIRKFNFDSECYNYDFCKQMFCLEKEKLDFVVKKLDREKLKKSREDEKCKIFSDVF